MLLDKRTSQGQRCSVARGEMGERMRAIDWSQTPLGPVASWPQSLKTCLRIVLTSQPADVRVVG